MVKRVLEEANQWIGYLEKKNNSNLEEHIKNAGHNNYTVFARDYYIFFGEKLPSLE